MQAFACLMRLYEADAAGAGVGGFLAPPAEQQPAVEAVRHLCWRMNISRCVQSLADIAAREWRSGASLGMR